uniref:LRRNT domain-containing protein n=1 Tax=Biomphalaria glabrata TaxID=6526 RepID=A0A2C9LAA2_BIOGL
MFVGESSFFLVNVSWMVFITMHAAIIQSNFTTMSSNQSVVFRCCSVFTMNETLVANCSNLNWTFVHLRCVPVITEVLLLDRNNLTTLTNGSFQTLTSLRQLSIQSSNVHRIEIDTFLGLSLLQTLNLENNKLSDIGNSFNPQTFRHLLRTSSEFKFWNASSLNCFCEVSLSKSSGSYFSLLKLIRLSIVNLELHNPTKLSFVMLVTIEQFKVRLFSWVKYENSDPTCKVAELSIERRDKLCK